MKRLRLRVIACPSFRPEMETLAAEATTAIKFCHLEMGLHERSAEALHDALQSAIDSEADADAIAIGYGLCNRGIVGLRAQSLPVIIPRAHDCIAMLLGTGRRYLAELAKEPGTYFQSAGWLENSSTNRDIRQPDFTFGPSSNVTRERLVERYGENNADYLLEEFKGFTKRYERLAYIRTPAPASDLWEAKAKAIAAKHNWRFEPLAGDIGWLRRLLNADWNSSEFLTLHPGERVVLRSDALLIGAEPT